MDDSLINLLNHRAEEAFAYFNIPIQYQRDLGKKLTEKHRFYHNYEHINDILKMVDSYNPLKYNNFNLTSIDRKILLAAALYHDAIYDPSKKDNENKSAEYFISHCSGVNRADEILQVTTIIRDTANHTPSTKLSQVFCDFDLRGLKEGNFSNLLIGEKKLFLEFQKFDYSDYKKGRISFLESFLEKNPGVNEANIKALINYVEFRVPKIGVYAGSFNPFHKGHLNIVEKAEQIFDKVIIAKGINPEKPIDKGLDGLDEKLYYRQTEAFSGLLTDYISNKSKDADITLIRGLRNGNDLSYEMNQIKFINEFDSNVKYIFIHCDQEYEHISSTALRTLLNSGDEKMIEKAIQYCDIN
jgi:pantetheine-phosphate adenylyltransferase